VAAGSLKKQKRVIFKNKNELSVISYQLSVEEQDQLFKVCSASVLGFN